MWFVNRVLPSLIITLPGWILTGIGLWIQYRWVVRKTNAQTDELKEKTDQQTSELKQHQRELHQQCLGGNDEDRS